MDSADKQIKPTGKVIEVEPAAAGPDVKPVRQKKPLTEAQKAALQKGRDRLAERRRQMREGSETASHVEELEEEKEPQLAAAEEPTKSSKKDASVGTDTDSDKESEVDETEEKTGFDAYDEAQTTAYCTVM
jgi:hypothetical protein